MKTDENPREPRVGIRGYRVRDAARHQLRRRQILLGAARAFARKGYQAASMDDIAQEAGLAKGHIYHYFAGKEDIFTQIRVTGVSRALERLEAVVNAGDPPDATLRCAVRDLVASAFGPIEQFAIVLADPPDLSPENHERVRTLQRKYESLVCEILERGIRQGLFVDGNPKLMMFTLIRAALGTAIWYRPHGQWEPDWIIEQVTAQLMRSVLAR
ncbi:MAG: TetR/AcrR family transcriptional regulator [Dehalococcoidia bacterium]